MQTYRDETRMGLRYAIHLRIGSMLRNLFGRIKAEPIPDEHVDLIMRLRRKERERARRERI
jgi:hypothetical protein